MSNTQTGNYGETLACEYLKKQGYKILERNYRIRGGEIDIIAKDERSSPSDKDMLVFVEVKARYSHEYGLPIESITPWKIKYLKKAIRFYLAKKKLFDVPVRVDAVCLDFTNGQKIELVKNIVEE